MMIGQQLLDKILGRIVNNSIKANGPPSVPMAQQSGIVAQGIQGVPQNTYIGMGAGIGVGGGGLLSGQAYQVVNPNSFNPINIGPGNTIKVDPDANITGVPCIYRAPFDSRSAADIEAYYGDQFKITEELFVTSFDLSVGKNEFHFLVWKALWGEAIRDYGFIMLMPKPKTILAFKTRDSRDQFVSWFEEYQERYPERNTSKWRIPPIRQGRTGGCFADRKEFSEAEVVQVWAWIIGHCAGSAAFLPNFILFDSENDAVMYRLRWG